MSYKFGSSLEDVVDPNSRFFMQWKSKKVTDIDIFTAFHTKYWGLDKKSMKQEEDDWRKSRTALDKMDVDNGDITDGCYVLEHGIKGIYPPKIWIRADYKRIYDELESWFNKDPTGMAPSAVVTGQPGIGKSVWIYYALRRRLGEQKPVIWYFEDKCYLFVNEGVFEKPDGFLSVHFTTLVWTLVDHLSGDPASLMGLGTRHFIIFTTSPNAGRWKYFNKSTRFMLCIMNPWTREEMLQLVSISDDLDVDFTTTIYDTYGPMPRLWNNLTDPFTLKLYKSEVQNAIATMTASKLEQVITDTDSLFMNAVSHKLILIKRVDLLQPRSLQIIAPITPHIQSLLANHFRSTERSEVIRLYKRFANIGGSHLVAGMLFEAFGQQRLQERIILDIVPMVQLPKVPHGNPQWYSSHTYLANNKLKKLHLGALQHKICLDVQPVRVIQFDGKPRSIEEGVYYLPEKSNQVAIDSFIVSSGFLYLFQFTIAESHGIEAGGLKKSLEAYRGIPAESHWRFVFIVPADSTVICPDGVGKVPLYSAAIAME